LTHYYCTVHVIFVMLVFFSGSESVHVFLSFVYICFALGDPIIKVSHHINQLNSAADCPKPES